MELQPWDIKVSIIEPGCVTTPIWEKSLDLADKIWHNLPILSHQFYSDAVNATRNTASKLSKNGFPAELVAKAVAHALTAKKPKTRYVVGLDALINIWLAKLLPTQLLDQVIIQYMGLSK